jgi:hypothetical protein
MQGTAGEGNLKMNAQLASIVREAVQSTAFSREIDIFITVLEKTYATLRANDSEPEVPGMPDIYFRMSPGLADVQVQTNEWVLPDGSNFKFTQADRKLVLDAYKKRLDMLHNRLHALGFVLSPYLHSKHRFDGLCMKATRDYIDAHFASNLNPDAAAQDLARCHNQLDFRDIFFWKAYLSIKQPLTAHDPIHPQVSSRHDP